MIRQFLKDESGVTAVEYSLIAAMVGIASITAFRSFGVEMAEMYGHVAQVVTDTIP